MEPVDSFCYESRKRKRSASSVWRGDDLLRLEWIQLLRVGSNQNRGFCAAGHYLQRKTTAVFAEERSSEEASDDRSSSVGRGSVEDSNN
ncbi:hypothetical protein Ddye_021706 [Dipteronia dyeriana]|uniref:Uncharacterized protein n=1 Tax=Dipteronia dyeriana TaxID=168575 RepID=A0AAD9U251_9ROSI|nr:hypothetical protein Ddye_021706 [Dipteronia dyeriana]